MRKLITLVGAVALASILSAADVSGKWTGRLFDDVHEQKGATFMLKQTGNEITGTAGPAEDRQFAISNAKLEGENLTFDVVTDDGPVMHFKLTVSEKRMAGAVHGEHEGQSHDGKIEMTKAE